MAVIPLKETADVYNRNQQCSRVEQLRDPAVVADYALNKGDFINKDLLNVYSESFGVIGKQGLSITASGTNVVINPGYGEFRNFIFNVPAITNITAAAMPNGTSYSLILKIVEKRFTSAATSGGSETDDNALEGTPGSNPYGNLWPQVTSGYDPNNCLQISINTISFDISNEWRYKYSFQLVSSVPANDNPIAATSINRFYVSLATVVKDSSGAISIIDNIFTNAVAYRNKPNYFLDSNQMAPSKMTIIQKTQNVPPFGNITNFMLSPSGQSDTYILNLDDATSLNGYNPLSSVAIPGIDVIGALPYGGNGHRFKLIIISSNPSKRLLISRTGGPLVSYAYPLSYQIPPSNQLGAIQLYPGSITSFSIYNNTLFMEEAVNHFTQNIYGDSNYSNANLYSPYTVHRSAIDSLANELHNGINVDYARYYPAIYPLYSSQAGNFNPNPAIQQSMNAMATRIGNMVTVQGGIKFRLQNAVSNPAFDSTSWTFGFSTSSSYSNIKLNPCATSSGQYLGSGTLFLDDPDHASPAITGVRVPCGYCDFFTTNNNTIIFYMRLSDLMQTSGAKAFFDANANYRLYVFYNLTYRTGQPF